MKTILVPTDYSEAARNAVHYAADLSKRIGGKLVIFHAYHVPMRMASGGVVVPSSGEELEAEEVKKLRHYAEAVKSLYPGTAMGHTVKAGFAVEEIVGYAGEEHFDMVVMGIGEGSHNSVFGSLTTSVIRESSRPVMIVPASATLRKNPRIALAYDFSGISDPSALDSLVEISKAFGSELMIVDVLKSDQQEVKKDASIGRLEGKVPYSLHFPVGEDPANTMLQFVDDNKIDIVATLPHKHGFFDRLLRTGFTDKLALHTHVPLLTLPC